MAEQKKDPQAAAPAPSKKAEPSFTLSELKDALLSAPPKEKQEFLSLLGVAQIQGTQASRKQRVDNEQIRKFAAVYGDATHDPDFEPAVPERVKLQGEAAAKAWLDRWHAGMSGQASQELDMEIERLVESGDLADTNAPGMKVL
jgi:hypothetical protein